MELSKDKETYRRHDLKFKDLKSRKNLEEKLLIMVIKYLILYHMMKQISLTKELI